MTERRIPSATAVVLASAIAAAGMVAHNVLEFGPAFLLNPETLIPLAIFGVFALFGRKLNRTDFREDFAGNIRAGGGSTVVAGLN